LIAFNVYKLDRLRKLLKKYINNGISKKESLYNFEIQVIMFRRYPCI